MGNYCQLLFFEKLKILMRDEDWSDRLTGHYLTIKFDEASTDPGAVP